MTWGTIKSSLGDLIYKVTCMKFQDPATGEEKVCAHMKALGEEIQQAFRALEP